MERKKEILNLIEKDDIKKLIEPAIDELLHIENQLLEIKKLPFFKVHPDNPSLQKELPAKKMYIQLLQQYNLLLFKILKVVGIDTSETNNLDGFLKYMETLNERLHQN